MTTPSPGSTHRPVVITLAVAAAVTLLVPGPAAAQPTLGVHVGVWEEGSEPLVGVELLTPLAPRWFLNPSLEVVPGDRTDWWILNGDVHYDLEVDAPAYLWVGGGVAILHRETELPFGRESSETDPGVNLLAGAGVKTSGGLVPYLQGKVVFSDESSAALVLGLRF